MWEPRRKVLRALALLPTVSACGLAVSGPKLSPSEHQQRKRFDDMGLVLVVDAVPGAEMLGVEMFGDEQIRPFFHRAAVTQRNRSVYVFGSPVPLQVRVVWRKERNTVVFGLDRVDALDEQGRYMGRPGVWLPALPNDEARVARRKLIVANTGKTHVGPWGSQYSGELAGDYLLSVAERIPDTVLADIRARGGGLRLKFRLKPDGVLFGWDIERDGAGSGYALRYDMPGGDFNAARIYGGKVVELGWEVQADESRQPVDY